jgi:prolyl 4-hydroxylase
MMDISINKPVIIENFISHDDCQYLIDTYKNKVQRSLIVNSNTGTSELHPSRTSSTFFLPANDRVVQSILEKVSNYLSVPINHIEGLQLLRYMKGEKYSYHHDYFKGENITNQRVHTIILYLNDLELSDGGATSFYHHSLKIQPKEGRAVWFRNITDSNELIESSLHSGEEIRTDVIKYAINIWTRQNPL